MIFFWEKNAIDFFPSENMALCWLRAAQVLVSQLTQLVERLLLP